MEILDLSQPEPFKGLFYAKPGTGKTRTSYSACFVEGMYPVLGLNLHGNPVSIRDYPRDRLSILNLTRVDDFDEPYEFIKRGQNPNSRLAREFGVKPGIKTVVIDSSTIVQSMYGNEATSNTTIKLSKIPNPTQIQDHGEILRAMTNFTELWVELADETGINIIFTALEQTKEGGSYFRPFYTGASADAVPGYFTLVARLVKISKLSRKEQEEIKDELEEESQLVAFFDDVNGKFYAKDQISEGRLGRFMVNPSMEKIMKAIRG